MKNKNTTIDLNQLNNYQSSRISYSIPCTILKNDDYQKLRTIEYILDKDVLAQMLYEGFYKNHTFIDEIPIIITVNDFLINGMERKGTYVLDGINDQFIYVFGKEDCPDFFENLAKLKMESLHSSILIATLNSNNSQSLIQEKSFEKLHYLIDLHGDIKGGQLQVEGNENITIELMNQQYKLTTFYWIERQEEEDY